MHECLYAHQSTSQTHAPAFVRIHFLKSPVIRMPPALSRTVSCIVQFYLVIPTTYENGKTKVKLTVLPRI